MSVQIRFATEADLPQILDIFNDAILHTTAVYSYEPITLEDRQTWFRGRQAQGFPVLVAEKENQVIGFSSYGTFRPWPAYGRTVENSIYIHPQCRGQGVGKLLLARLIEQAKAQGYHAMMAGIDSSNPASLRLHECFGFVQVGYLKEVGFKFGRWLDLVFMELLLDS